jgi:hypothetical protein
MPFPFTRRKYENSNPHYRLTLNGYDHAPSKFAAFPICNGFHLQVAGGLCPQAAPMIQIPFTDGTLNESMRKRFCTLCTMKKHTFEV